MADPGFSEWRPHAGNFGRRSAKFVIHIFGSFGKEPMQSCFVWHVSLSLALFISVSMCMSCVHSCPSDSFDYRSFISQIYAHMLLVYTHKIFCQCDIYFWNGSHFSKLLYVALLSIGLSLELSYLAQLYAYTGDTYKEEIMQLCDWYF